MVISVLPSIISGIFRPIVITASKRMCIVHLKPLTEIVVTVSKRSFEEN